MIDQAILTLVQYVIVFVTTLVFSLIALQRESIVSNGLAMLLWVIFGIMNFMVGYTLIGEALSWLLGLLGFIFAGNFLIAIRNVMMQDQKTRYEF